MPKPKAIREWTCPNCGRPKSGTVRVDVVKGDVTGCADCIQPDPELMQQAVSKLVQMSEQHLNRQGYTMKGMSADWIYAISLKLLGIPDSLDDLRKRYLAKYPETDR